MARNANPERWYKWLNIISETLKKANKDKTVPLYITEMGWPTDNQRGGKTDEEAAGFLARSVLLASTISAIKGLWWYEFKDKGWNRNDRKQNWGLVRPSGARKAAFYALSTVSDLLSTASSRPVVVKVTDNKDIWAVEFKGSQPFLALWTEDGRTLPLNVHYGAYNMQIEVDGLPLFITPGGPGVAGANANSGGQAVAPARCCDQNSMRWAADMKAKRN